MSEPIGFNADELKYTLAAIERTILQLHHGDAASSAMLSPLGSARTKIKQLIDRMTSALITSPDDDDVPEPSTVDGKPTEYGRGYAYGRRRSARLDERVQAALDALYELTDLIMSADGAPPSQTRLANVIGKINSVAR